MATLSGRPWKNISTTPGKRFLRFPPPLTPGTKWYFFSSIIPNSFHIHPNQLLPLIGWSRSRKHRVRKLLKVNPAERLPLNECLEHPWFEVSGELWEWEGWDKMWGWLIEIRSWRPSFLAVTGELAMVAMFYFSVVMVSQKDSCGHLKFSHTNKFVFVAPLLCWCQTGTQIDSTPKWLRWKW